MGQPAALRELLAAGALGAGGAGGGTAVHGTKGHSAPAASSSSPAELLPVTAQWAAGYSQSQQASRGMLPPRGWFRTVAMLQAYVMRPAPTLHARLSMAMHSTGMATALAGGTPVLGLHVRHGDSCGRDRYRTRRHCDPLSVYMGAVSILTRGLGVRTIYLATDSEEVLAQTRQYPEYTWLHFPDALRFARAVNPENKRWDAVLKTNREK